MTALPDPSIPVEMFCRMTSMDSVLASMSPDDTAAALRLLKILEECRQMDAAEAEEWRRRITGWARFNEVEAGAPSA